ncbi:MAG: minor capsid protein [Liquorilactobacillus sp.]|uniref:minor capsid protein n=1 Tax=Liquorilactobacillus TaxID=2767888 RepID=UPI0039EBD7B1
MGIKVSSNLSALNNIKNAAESARVVAPALSQMEMDMQRFVPYRQGNLTRDSYVNTQNRQIVYKMPYAKAQFYGVVGGKYPIENYTTTTHPQAGKRWDLRGKATFGDDWKQVIANSLMKEAKHGGS